MQLVLILFNEFEYHILPLSLNPDGRPFAFSLFKVGHEMHVVDGIIIETLVVFLAVMEVGPLQAMQHGTQLLNAVLLHSFFLIQPILVGSRGLGFETV